MDGYVEGRGGQVDESARIRRGEGGSNQRICADTSWGGGVELTDLRGYVLGRGDQVGGIRGIRVILIEGV